MNPADPRDFYRRIEAVEKIQMLTSLNNLRLKKLEEIKREQGVNLTLEGKIHSLERELEVRHGDELLYTQVLTELTDKLSESELREERLRESLDKAERDLQGLRDRVTALEIEKLSSDSRMEKLAREKSEADEIVNESRRMNLKAREAAEVNIERFGNVVPIAENLFKLLKRNMEDLVGMKDTLLGEGRETNMHRLTEVVSSSQGLKRKRSESSPLLRKRLFGADMARAFHEDDDMCVEAVCMLYRQHMSDSESSEGSKRRFYHFDRLWQLHGLANFLFQGDPELRVTRPVAEVKQHVVDLCRRLAIEYSSYFIAMPGTPTSGPDEPRDLSLCLEEGEHMSLDDIIEI